MATFANDVFNAFKDLQTQHRFVPVRATATNRFAALLRKESDTTYAYILVHDGRPGNANLDVDLWIAPPDDPSESLDKMYVGFRVRIGSEFTVDDSFFVNCQSRIVHYLNCFLACSARIDEELNNPSFRTKRWKAYQIERSAYLAFLALVKSGDKDAMEAVAASMRVAKKGGSMNRLESSFSTCAAALINGELLENGVAQFYRGNTTSLASTLAIFSHVNALGEMSRHAQ